MKKQYLTIATVLIALAALSAGAQGQGERDVVANIPYQFVAGNITLSAGTYTIGIVEGTRGLLQIRNNETRHSEFLLAQPSASTSDDLKVRLQRVGDTYYLSGIVTLSGVYSLPTPKAAANLAMTSQRNSMTPSGSD